MKTAKQAFSTAWLIAKAASKKFGGNVAMYFIESLKLAYKQIKAKAKSANELTKADLIQIMLHHTIVVSFFKKDGSKRFMYGTLNREYIESNHVSNSSKTRTVPNHQIIIFDAELNEYRSFIIDNLIDYAIID